MHDERAKGVTEALPPRGGVGGGAARGGQGGAGLRGGFVGPRGESLYDGNVEPHYHLICGDTGEVVDVPPPTVHGRPLGAFLKAYVEQVTGWQGGEARPRP